MTAASPLRPEYEVFAEIGFIEAYLSEAVSKSLPPGMTYAHFEILMFLDRLGDGRAPTELAGAMVKPRRALQTALRQMEALGLICILADTQDRRRRRVRLTRSGRDAFQQIQLGFDAKRETLMTGFTEGEFREALPFLRSLRRFLEEVKLEAVREGASLR